VVRFIAFLGNIAVHLNFKLSSFRSRQFRTATSEAMWKSGMLYAWSIHLTPVNSSALHQFHEWHLWKMGWICPC